MGRKEIIASRIRELRKERNMTHADLAKAIRQSPSSISMYENGRREPDFETLEAIADVFNVPLSDLLLTKDPSDEERRWSEFALGEMRATPKTHEARIISGGIDRMPPERREQALKILQLAFSEYAEFFKEGSDDNDT